MLFRKLLSLFRRQTVGTVRESEDDTTQKTPSRCSHGGTSDRITMTILGSTCTLVGSPMCPACTETYLNMYSTICARCREPILPGTPVGRSSTGARYPFLHLRFDCCQTGALYCGMWGEGCLISLHELKPDTYPEGTLSVLDHTLRTGKMVVENIP